MNEDFLLELLSYRKSPPMISCSRWWLLMTIPRWPLMSLVTSSLVAHGQGRHNVFTQVHSSSLLHFTSFTPRSLRTENVWIWWNVSLFKTFINFWKELPRVKCKFSLFYHSKLLLNCYLKWEMMHINIFLVPQTSSNRSIGRGLLPESIEVELNLPLKIQFKAEANNGWRKFK